MKKWLLAAGLGLADGNFAQAADKIAIVNMGNLFQQVAQKTGVSATGKRIQRPCKRTAWVWKTILLVQNAASAA